MVQQVSARSMRIFVIVWTGQFVSLLGSGLTKFALGVWIFLETGSVTPLALIALFTVIPHIVLGPFVGTLVDRWDRRKAMILSDSGDALCTLALATLLYVDHLEIWHVFVIALVSSGFSTFQWPAYSAATTLIVPKKHLSRAAGMVQTAQSASNILSPMIAGLLVVTIKIWGVFAIDFATFLFALVTLLIVRIPKPETTADGKKGKGSFLKEVAYGWSYIRARSGLLALLIFFAGTNLAYSSFSVLFTPMVLSFASPASLGTLESAGGIGMFIGGVLLSVWGGPRKRIYGVLGFGFLSGVAAIFLGIRPNLLIIACANFACLFTVPFIGGCSQAIWQVKTAPDVQGRVFSLRRAISWSTTPVSLLLLGPLADKVFEPAMAAEGILRESVGTIIGTGPGRGIALLTILLGVFVIIITIICFLYPRLRYVEDELPDMIAESPE
jgi:DHA3 family macrolide efflux protein-like MFS transporter